MANSNGHGGRPRTVLLIVTSFWALGELTIALEFAHRLPAAGYRPLMLVPPTHRATVAAAGLAHQVLIPNAGKINRMLLADIQQVYRPSMVVLADFLNFDFCDRHYGLGRDDLSVFDCPVGTFDDFSWGRPGAWMDTYGFRARYEGDMTIDGLNFRLRPCPLNHPSLPRAPDVYPYPMLRAMEDLRDESAAGTAAVRAEFGLDARRPLVLLTNATWQGMHIAYPFVTTFVDACRAMVERILLRVLPHADVVSVGPPSVFRGSGPPGFRTLDQLDADRFQRLVRTVDLHLSNNIVSVSLHRLALGGVPSVVLLSSLSRADGRLCSVGSAEPKISEYAAELLDTVRELYPYRMFPVGWYYFLDSLLEGNPLSEVVSYAETFDEDAAGETIVALLTDSAQQARVEQARQAYVEALRRLPNVASIVDRIAEVPA